MTGTERHGIVSYGAYVPYHRLDRTVIRATLGQGGGTGTRTVSAYDEDTTSMGVEAARRALWGAPTPESLYFATTAPAYTDKTNATAIHAALGGGRERLRHRPGRRGARRVRCPAGRSGDRRDGRAVRRADRPSRLGRRGVRG